MKTISRLHRLLEHIDWVETACAQKHGSSVPGHLHQSLRSGYLIKIFSRIV